MIATEEDFLNDGWSKETYYGIVSYTKTPDTASTHIIYKYHPGLIDKIKVKFFNKQKHKTWTLITFYYNEMLRSSFDTLNELHEQLGPL